MKTPRTVEVACDDCKHPMKVRVGPKDACYHVECHHCSQGWDYSCFVIKKTDIAVFTKFEAFKCEGGCMAD